MSEQRKKGTKYCTHQHVYTIKHIETKIQTLQMKSPVKWEDKEVATKEKIQTYTWGYGFGWWVTFFVSTYGSVSSLEYS